MLLVRTSGGGWMVGEVRGTGLSVELERDIRAAADSKVAMMLSNLIARLTSRGFTIVSQSAAPASADFGAPAGCSSL